MELVDRRAESMTGVVVAGAFTELGSLVPAAWRSLAAAGAPRDATYVELSRAGGDGTYVECLGLLDDGATGTSQLAGLTGGTLELERVQVTAGAWVRSAHDGGEDQIAVTFGRMIEWARAAGLEPTGELLDVGYRLDAEVARHELWVNVEPAAGTSRR